MTCNPCPGTGHGAPLVLWPAARSRWSCCSRRLRPGRSAPTCRDRVVDRVATTSGSPGPDLVGAGQVDLDGGATRPRSMSAPSMRSSGIPTGCPTSRSPSAWASTPSACGNTEKMPSPSCARSVWTYATCSLRSMICKLSGIPTSDCLGSIRRPSPPRSWPASTGWRFYTRPTRSSTLALALPAMPSRTPTQQVYEVIEVFGVARDVRRIRNFPNTSAVVARLTNWPTCQRISRPEYADRGPIRAETTTVRAGSRSRPSTEPTP